MMVCLEKKRIYLHRFVVENLVRPLKDEEIVHHIDDNKFNNEISNLEILVNQAEHIARHDFFRKQNADTFEKCFVDGIEIPF